MAPQQSHKIVVLPLEKLQMEYQSVAPEAFLLHWKVSPKVNNHEGFVGMLISIAK